ncbi:MAG: DUF4377 domain-containing protein [Gemmatimonadaceae bacterium]|nr:DUF4377 domain-containing protein [Gemmatimonadaceae bacterium]MCW5826548.1 DUF4377 domain-containing protein [Gemmatimonadaceae bacterium]
MSRLRIHFSILALAAGLVGCAEPFASRDEVQFTVLEERAACFAPFPTTCYQVIWPGESESKFFSAEIEGFTFEPGVRQHIRVERRRINNPPADGSSYHYRLIRVILRLEVGSATATN